MSNKQDTHFSKRQGEEKKDEKEYYLNKSLKVNNKYKSSKNKDKINKSLKTEENISKSSKNGDKISKEHEVYLKKVISTKRRIAVTRVLILVIFIALWQIAASFKWIDPFLTSSPSRVIKSFISLYEDGSLFKHIGITCYETILGFSLGTILGALMAIILWSFPLAAKILDPYLVVLNALPKVALAPIIIFWIGNGMPAIIVIALLISVVTTVISVLTGFNEIDTEKIMLMNTFRASKVQILRYLIFPYSIPIFISALKINVGLSWVGVIMGEFLVAKNGLGFLIVYGGQVAQLDMVMMSIVILSAIAFIMYEMVAFAEKNLVKDKN